MLSRELWSSRAPGLAQAIAATFARRKTKIPAERPVRPTQAKAFRGRFFAKQRQCETSFADLIGVELPSAFRDCRPACRLPYAARGGSNWSPCCRLDRHRPRLLIRRKRRHRARMRLDTGRRYPPGENAMIGFPHGLRSPAHLKKFAQIGLESLPKVPEGDDRREALVTHGGVWSRQ